MNSSFAALDLFERGGRGLIMLLKILGTAAIVLFVV
jgi:hypothetical protein